MDRTVTDLKDERVPPCLYWSIEQVADWVEQLGFPHYRVSEVYSGVRNGSVKYRYQGRGRGRGSGRINEQYWQTVHGSTTENTSGRYLKKLYDTIILRTNESARTHNNVTCKLIVIQRNQLEDRLSQ